TMAPRTTRKRRGWWCRGGMAKLRKKRTKTNRLSTESDFSSRYPAKNSRPCSPPYLNQTKKPKPTESTIQNTLHQTASLNVEDWSREEILRSTASTKRTPTRKVAHNSGLPMLRAPRSTATFTAALLGIRGGSRGSSAGRSGGREHAA